MENNKSLLSGLAGDKAETPGQITVGTAGARGGRRTLALYGRAHFVKIGQLGGMRTKELYGHLLVHIGRKGGRPRRPPLNEHEGEKDPQ